MFVKHTALAGIAASIVLAATVGCGGEEPAQRTTTSQTQAAATASPEPSRDVVAIAGFEFRPQRLTVRAGSRVTWVDKDASNHTVTFDGGPGDLGNVNPGERLRARFDESGTYAYVCQYHPNMRGTIVVK
jgi:plastocyanin